MTDLITRLRGLGLIALADGWEDVVALVTTKRWSLTQAIEHVVALEEKERARCGLERRQRRSKLERFKPMVEYDWNWPDQIDRPLVESALALDFLPAHRNIVLAAAQGLGKTMIAKNIVQHAVLAGHSALFITASDLLFDLGKQESARALERRIRYYAGITLLAIDEIGFLAFDNRNADLLFQIVSRRYEKKSIVLTTNLLFRDWSTIFPNAMCATALIERIVHHADVISIQGKSFRAREAEQDTKERTQRRPKAKPKPQSEGEPPPPPAS
jgi:DNA replication protein DnaC